MNNSVWVCSLVLLIPPLLSQIRAVAVWPFFVGGQGFQPFNPSYLLHSQKS